MTKSTLDPEFGLRGRAVRTDTVLDCDEAALVLAERRVNQAVIGADMSVDNGEVFLFDGPGFPDFPQFAGQGGIFGDEDDPAGFAVETVDQTRPKAKGWRLGNG